MNAEADTSSTAVCDIDWLRHIRGALLLPACVEAVQAGPDLGTLRGHGAGARLQRGPAGHRTLILVDHLTRHHGTIRADELAAEVAYAPPATTWVAPVALIAGLRSGAIAALARQVATARGEDEIGQDATAVHAVAVAAIARHGGQPVDVDGLIALLGTHARTAACRQALQIVRALATSTTASPPAEYLGTAEPFGPVAAALTAFLHDPGSTVEHVGWRERQPGVDIAAVLGAALRGAFLGEAAAAPWAHRLESSFDIFTAAQHLVRIGHRPSGDDAAG